MTKTLKETSWLQVKIKIEKKCKNLHVIPESGKETNRKD